MRSREARSAELSRRISVARVLTSSGCAKMAEKVVTFLSSRLRQIYRKQESRGKSASQLTASGQRKFQGKRRALESHARTGSCQMNSGEQPRKETPVVSPTRRSSF